MRKVGVFDKKHPCAGRPIWMVVSEDQGKEFDTSAAICEPISSRTVNNSADADEEQWDICDDTPPLAPIFAAKKLAHASEQPNSVQASKRFPSTLKKPNKTPSVTVSKIPETTGQRPNNAAASESKKQRSTGPTAASSIASKVMLGTCGVKVRLFGRVFDSSHSLEDTKPRHESRVNSSLQSAIESGSCAVKVRIMGEVFDPRTNQGTQYYRTKSNELPQDTEKPRMQWISNDMPKRIRSTPKKFVARPSKQGLGVEEGDVAFLDARSKTPSSAFVDGPSEAPLRKRDRKLAPIFTKKYTRSSSQMQKNESLNSPINRSVDNPRRSSRGKQCCNTRGNQNTLSTVVSDDGLSATSQELHMPRRKVGFCKKEK